MSQTTGETRLRWDPFINEQHLMDGADVARPRAYVPSTQHRFKVFRMISEYVSFNPPTNVGMKMIDGPWFFESFAGGWRFAPEPGGGTRATWRYNFRCKPRWLAPIADRIGKWILQRDIDRRISGFARGCADPEVLAAVRAQGDAT